MRLSARCNYPERVLRGHNIYAESPALYRCTGFLQQAAVRDYLTMLESYMVTRWCFNLQMLLQLKAMIPCMTFPAAKFIHREMTPRWDSRRAGSPSS